VTRRGSGSVGSSAWEAPRSRATWAGCRANPLLSGRVGQQVHAWRKPLFLLGRLAARVDERLCASSCRRRFRLPEPYSCARFMFRPLLGRHVVLRCYPDGPARHIAPGPEPLPLASQNCLGLVWAWGMDQLVGRLRCGPMAGMWHTSAGSRLPTYPQPPAVRELNSCS
jgi:hypothetical protein